MKYNAAIIGTQGYAGRELARLLLSHPHIELTQVYSRNPDWHLSHDLPEAVPTTVKHSLVAELSDTCPDVDILFLATPHDVSLELIPLFKNKINWIIDLSGAFRLPAEIFTQWYQQPHSATDELANAQYGLCPWQIKKPTSIIANPGCYATAVLMALLPLANAGLLNDETIIIDAKSGISGAGRGAKTELLFGEITHNFFPYKIGKHQHTPEVEEAINQFTPSKAKILLTTQVLPLPRGISASIYVPHSLASKELVAKVTSAYQQAYENYSLVRFAHLPDLSAKAQQHFLSLQNVVGSCRTHIAYQDVGDHLVIFSMLDNLLKGAASQAIENANRALGLSLTCGLETIEGIL